MTEEDDQVSPRRGELRLSLALLILFPAILAALAFWFGTEYQRLGSSEEDARRAHARQLLFSEFFSSIKDAETGQRGYIITGDPAFLAPYRTGQAEMRRDIDALKADPANAEEQRRLERIGALIDTKVDEMERVIVLRREQGLAAAAAAVSEGRGKQVMDEIRREAALARRAEATALAHTLAAQRERTRQTEWIMWIAVALTAMIFVVIGYLFWRSARERDALGVQAREAAARRRAIFDSTLDAIILINPSGSVETMNRAASRLLGYAERDLARRDIGRIIDLAPGDGPFLDRIGLQEGQLIEPFRHRLAASKADGTTVPVEAALGAMPLPDGIHIVAALRDISEREKAERIKDQFLSTVSHELRTPLTSIVGSLGLLRSGVNGELPAATQRLLVIAENNANRLIRLVNDLLDIEKFEAGEMSFEFAPIDLREAAAKAIDTVTGLAQEKAVTLDLAQDAAPVIVRGDAERLAQVMTNLLANAIRFTPDGGRVVLATAQRGHLAEVSVTDQGPGIDAELRGRLFTRFAQSIQVQAGTSRGTGLGLAISREIVRNHGGGIWYDPAPGGGSVFSFNMPLWNLASGQPESAGARRVLICAHDGESARIAAALEGRSIHADIVHDTGAMFDALQGGRYLALLLDGQILGADTMLGHRIRNAPATRALPIVAITADGGPDTHDIGLLDLVDWIPRPLDPARLNEALASAMERAATGMPLILHVDDDTDTLEITASALEGRARMAHATDMASARALIAEQRPDMIIIDLGLPDGSGEELVADLARSGDLSTPVIIYSAQERNGAFAREVSAVLTKSKRSLSVLVGTIEDILDREPAKGGDDER